MSDERELAYLGGVLEFLRAAERLKVTTRSAYTSEGRAESVAEHSWRVCLMALVLRNEFPGIDLGKLIAMCVIHDLGEAIGGDVPAPEQAARLARDPKAHKSAQEREDLLTLLEPLPERIRAEITARSEERRVGKECRTRWRTRR